MFLEVKVRGPQDTTQIKLGMSLNNGLSGCVCLFVCLHSSSGKGSQSQSELSLRLNNQSEDSIISAVSAEIMVMVLNKYAHDTNVKMQDI